MVPIFSYSPVLAKQDCTCTCVPYHTIAWWYSYTIPYHNVYGYTQYIPWVHSIYHGYTQHLSWTFLDLYHSIHGHSWNTLHCPLRLLALVEVASLWRCPLLPAWIAARSVASAILLSFVLPLCYKSYVHHVDSHAYARVDTQSVARG